MRKSSEINDPVAFFKSSQYHINASYTQFDIVSRLETTPGTTRNVKSSIH